MAVGVMGLTAASASAQPTIGPSASFSCQASAAVLLGMPLVVANQADTPCASNSQSAINIPGIAGVANAATVLAPGNTGATAGANVANLLATNPLPGLPSLGLTLAQSTATATCTAAGSPPTLTGSSNVVGLNVGGTPYGSFTTPLTLNVIPGILTIYANRTITTPGRLTQRALEIDLFGRPLLIAGQSTVDFTGTCA
jgi:hypothetical protein